MTALDEGQGSSATLTLTVSAAPFSLGEFVSSYGIMIIVVVLIALSGGFMLVKNRSPPSDSGPVSGMDQTKSLKKVSVDDAFDDPDYDPFDAQSRREGPKSKSLEPATENLARWLPYWSFISKFKRCLYLSQMKIVDHITTGC